MTEIDLDALRAGDEAAFRALVEAHVSALLRLAMVHAPSRAVAEEVVQETWIAVLRSIDGFEGRSSLRTWMSRILINISRRRAGREGRSVPFSELGAEEDGEPSVDPDRFHPDGPNAGHWISIPVDPAGLPDRWLQSAEVRERVAAAIARLGAAQRTTFLLRDVEGWPAGEVSELLGVTPGHQRVLLHRARAKVRQALEDLL